MPTGPQVTLALGVGYVLGRRPRRKLAIMLGTAALAGGTSGAAGQLVRRGVKMAGSSLGSTEALSKVAPGLGEIGGIVRGELLDAAKTAGMAAVNSRIESMSDQLRDRAETLRNPADKAAPLTGEVIGDGEDQDSRDDERSPRPARRPAAAARPERAIRSATGTGRRGTGQGRRSSGEAQSSTGQGRRGTGETGRSGPAPRSTGQGRRTTGAAGRTASGTSAPARPQRRRAQQAGSSAPVRRASRTTSQGR